MATKLVSDTPQSRYTSQAERAPRKLLTHNALKMLSGPEVVDSQSVFVANQVLIKARNLNFRLKFQPFVRMDERHPF